MYNRYTRIKDEYKNIFFQEMKRSYLELLEDEELFDDFIDNLTPNNKNIFVQVISTENNKDFELLREMYSSIQKSMGD